MMARNFLRFFSVVASLSLALGPKASAGSKATTAPGTYRDLNDIDEITIVQPFHLDSYQDIAVETFDITNVPLPDPKENTYQAVQAALSRVKPAFLEGFQRNLRRKPGTNEIVNNRPSQRPNTLVIRARLTKVDPGSQAARYFGGFGMGAVKVAIVGEIIDAASKRTLVRFAQERRSGFGAFGGGYGQLFARTARQIGEDVAGLLNAF